MADNYTFLSSATHMTSAVQQVPPNKIAPESRVQSFNSGWKFLFGEHPGAQSLFYDDSGWKDVCLPHDYSITQEFTESAEAQSAYLPGGVGWYRKKFYVPQELGSRNIVLYFDGIYMDATIYVNGVELANHPYGYSPFSVNITSAINPGEHNVVAVRVNHQTPSSRWYSGSGIYRNVDLVVTPAVHIAHESVVVRALNIESYSGVGELTVEITTRLVNRSADTLNVQLTHICQPFHTNTLIGKTAQSTELAPYSQRSVSIIMPLESPALWDIDNPALYKFYSELALDAKTIDTCVTTTGFRSIVCDPDTGFMLNGRSIKLKGVCLHHDQGALGAVAYRAAIERQLDVLLDMGANSVRITHNPASRDLIELANEKGILLIEELFDGWHLPKNGDIYDYSRFFAESVPESTALENVQPNSTWARFDLESTIRRDVNAPSIIMWSIGNEIQEGTTGELSQFASYQKDLVHWVANMDRTRAITRGDNRLKFGDLNAHPVMHEMVTAARRLNVEAAIGANYANALQYAQIHAEHPGVMLYGSETVSAVNSRGVYNRYTDTGRTADKQLTSYDGSAVNWGHTASEAWLAVIDRDYIAGTYVWTGFDYLGEPTNWNGITPGAQGSWPSPKNSYFGIIDLAGLPKDSYYFYQSQWNERVTTLHILPAWNKEVVCDDGSGTVKVVVYSNAPRVKLYFTPQGSSERTLIGEKRFTIKTSCGGRFAYRIYDGDDASAIPHENMYLSWQVPYQDGMLSAEAFDTEGNLITATSGRSVVSTAGAPALLTASARRQEITADGNDVDYVEISVCDESGNLVPYARDFVTCSVIGEGTLIATDNGEQADHTSFQSHSRKAYHGKLMAIVQSTKQAGSLELRADAPGLRGAAVNIATHHTREPGAAQNSNDASGTQVCGNSELDYYILPCNYYVKSGSKVELPTTAEAVYVNGTHAASSIAWEENTDALGTTTGSFAVSGESSLGDRLSVNVNILEDIAAFLNYDAVTTQGKVPNIPVQRPLITSTGEILDVQLPVHWQMPAAEAFDAVGKVTINGTGIVFGEEYSVLARIDVQPSRFVIGESITAAAVLSVDLPRELYCGTLDAIKDGVKNPSAKTASVKIASVNDDGTVSRVVPDQRIWSNFGAAQRGKKDAQIVFEYDTQQLFGQFVVTFYQDAYAARYPCAHTTKFYAKDNAGDEWVEINADELIAEKSIGGTREYRYDLAEPVLATFVKLVVTSADQDGGNRNQNGDVYPLVGVSQEVSDDSACAHVTGVNESGGSELQGDTYAPCVAITEVELRTAITINV